MNQEELDLWIKGCITHYKKNTNKVMVTIEERIERLEQAHSRLYNQQKTMLDDLTKVQNKLLEEIKNINSQLSEGKDLDLLPLPDKLIEGKKYSAEITEIIKREDIIWRKINYSNW
jgi:molecular chaperone GrpE (heat shock protein)